MSIFAQDTLTLVFVGIMAVVANASAFVWGPNMVYLVQPKRPIAQSIAYTVGRALVLTVASALMVWALIAANQNPDQLADQIRAAASRPHPILSVAIGAVLIGFAYRIWKRPPALLTSRTFASTGDSSARLWPAFALGITIMFANMLEFVWQVLALGSAAAASRNSLLIVGIAAVLWTLLGTATLWAPTLLRVFAPGWSTDRFTDITKHMPEVKPWAVALPVALIGVAIAVFGVFKALR